VQPGIGGDVELARELRDGTLDFEYTLEPNVPLGKVQLSILYEIEVRKLNVLLLQAKGQFIVRFTRVIHSHSQHSKDQSFYFSN
jgi:hypothetical protein